MSILSFAKLYDQKNTFTVHSLCDTIRSSGLSLIKTSERHFSIKRNHVSIWNCIRKYKLKKILQKKRKKVEGFIIDETLKLVTNLYVFGVLLIQ